LRGLEFERRRKVEGGGRWLEVCGARSEGERERK